MFGFDVLKKRKFLAPAGDQGSAGGSSGTPERPKPNYDGIHEGQVWVHIDGRTEEKIRIEKGRSSLFNYLTRQQELYASPAALEEDLKQRGFVFEHEGKVHDDTHPSLKPAAPQAVPESPVTPAPSPSNKDTSVAVSSSISDEPENGYKSLRRRGKKKSQGGKGESKQAKRDEEAERQERRMPGDIDKDVTPDSSALGADASAHEDVPPAIEAAPQTVAAAPADQTEQTDGSGVSGNALEAEVVSADRQDTAAEQEGEKFPFTVLKNGERQLYFAPDEGGGVVRIIEKFPDGYRHYSGDNFNPVVDHDVPFTEALMRAMVKRREWERQGEVLPPRTPEPGVSPAGDKIEEDRLHDLVQGSGLGDADAPTVPDAPVATVSAATPENGTAAAAAPEKTKSGAALAANQESASDSEGAPNQEQFIFYPLPNGMQQVYVSSYSVPPHTYVVVKFPHGYEFYNQAKPPLAFPHLVPLNEEQMRTKVKDRGWRVQGEATPYEAPASAAEKYPFTPLADGMQQEYFDTQQQERVTVIKLPFGYEFYYGDESTILAPVGYTEEEMRSRASKRGWEVRGEPVPYVAPAVENQAAVPQTLAEQIEELKAKMGEFRQKYAEVDYENTSAWKTLTGFFRNLKFSAQDGTDATYWASQYHEQLQLLKQLELERIDQAGLTGQERKAQMAGVLEYYRIYEPQELYAARTQVRLERQGALGKVWGAYEASIKTYGKAPLWVKAGVSLGLLGLAIPTGGASLVARRFLAGSGAAMGIDALAEKLLRARETKRTKQGIDELVGVGEDDREAPTIDELEQHLNQNIQDINVKLQNKKNYAATRKLLAFSVGILAGATPELVHALQGEVPHVGTGAALSGASTPHTIGEQTIARPPVAAASAVESSASAPGGGIVQHSLPSATPEAPASGVSGNGVGQANLPAGETGPGARGIGSGEVEARVPVTPESASVAHILDNHAVTGADSKRGLWGILEKRLSGDMPEMPVGERHRIVQSLENLMQEKLDGMSVADQRAAGFPTGQIDMIHRDSTLDFSRLGISEEDVQAIYDGQNIAAPHPVGIVHAEGVSESTADSVGRDTDTGRQSLEATALRDRLQGQSVPLKEAGTFPLAPGEKASLLQQFQAMNIEQVNRLEGADFETAKVAWTDPKTFLMEHPEAKGRLYGTIGKLRQEIFMTSATHDLADYDYATRSQEMGGARITQVLKDASALRANPLTAYNVGANPLHFSQMQELSKFMGATRTAFGEIAKAEAGENINHYSSRMATLALRTGQAIPGFYKP